MRGAPKGALGGDEDEKALPAEKTQQARQRRILIKRIVMGFHFAEGRAPGRSRQNLTPFTLLLRFRHTTSRLCQTEKQVRVAVIGWDGIA